MSGEWSGEWRGMSDEGRVEWRDVNVNMQYIQVYLRSAMMGGEVHGIL